MHVVPLEDVVNPGVSEKELSLSGRQQTDWRAPLSTPATARHTGAGTEGKCITLITSGARGPRGLVVTTQLSIYECAKPLAQKAAAETQGIVSRTSAGFVLS